MKKIAGISVIALVFLYACEQINERETKYSDGKLKERWSITVEEGKELRNGPYEAWYKNGVKKHDFHYVDDEKHGVQKSYYKNGKLEVQENYLNGIITGKRKKWDKEGNLLSETAYKDGERNGLHINYYPSGKIHEKINYVNNQKNGLHITYDENTLLKSAAWFLDGTQIEAPPDSAKIVESEIKKDTSTTKPEDKKKEEKVDEEEKGV